MIVCNLLSRNPVLIPHPLTPLPPQRKTVWRYLWEEHKSKRSEILKKTNYTHLLKNFVYTSLYLKLK